MGITYEPFKGRSVAHGERVCVYRNLKFGDRVVWSIARATATGNRGEVVGHVQGCDGVALSDCVAREKGSRQAAIQAGADREVCAWVEGTLAGAPDSLSAGAGAHVTYAPKTRAGFFYAATAAAFTGASAVVFTAHMWAVVA